MSTKVFDYCEKVNGAGRCSCRKAGEALCQRMISEAEANKPIPVKVRKSTYIEDEQVPMPSLRDTMSALARAMMSRPDFHDYRMSHEWPDVYAPIPKPLVSSEFKTERFGAAYKGVWLDEAEQIMPRMYPHQERMRAFMDLNRSLADLGPILRTIKSEPPESYRTLGGIPTDKRKPHHAFLEDPVKKRPK